MAEHSGQESYNKSITWMGDGRPHGVSSAQRAEQDQPDTAGSSMNRAVRGERYWQERAENAEAQVAALLAEKAAWIKGRNEMAVAAEKAHERQMNAEARVAALQSAEPDQKETP